MSSALTGHKKTADGAPGVGWRAAGRLEHATFAALGCGPARSSINTNGANGVSTRDCEVLRRLLRRGAAAAAEAADAERLTLEGRRRRDAARVSGREAKTRARHRHARGQSGGPIHPVRRRHAQTAVPAAARRPVEGDQLEPVRPARAGRVGLAVGGEDRLRRRDAVRYPATRAAAEMALAAAAARTRPGAPVWIYGARVEGVFSAARDDGRETVVKRSLFRDVSVVFASACGGFRRRRGDARRRLGAKAGTTNAGSTGSKRSRRSCCHARTPVRLFPRASRKRLNRRRRCRTGASTPGCSRGGAWT